MMLALDKACFLYMFAWMLYTVAHFYHCTHWNVMCVLFMVQCMKCDLILIVLLLVFAYLVGLMFIFEIPCGLHCITLTWKATRREEETVTMNVPLTQPDIQKAAFP